MVENNKKVVVSNREPMETNRDPMDRETQLIKAYDLFTCSDVTLGEGIERIFNGEVVEGSELLAAARTTMRSAMKIMDAAIDGRKAE